MGDISLNCRPRRMVSTRRRCPACRSRSFSVSELVECTTTWLVRDGRFDREEGFHEPGGISRSLYGECACGHHWSLRNTLQIDDIVEGQP